MESSLPAQRRRVLLAAPRGFCAGVVRAIDIVNLSLEKFGSPLYVRKEIVHNRLVVGELKERGVVFVDELDEVPDGGLVIFSAHGVSPEVRRRAAGRDLRVIDATCPLVTKVHHEAVRYSREGHTIVLIGHRNHDEVVGTLGEAPDSTVVVGTVREVDELDVPDPARISYITQTTLSIDDARHIVERLRQRFPLIKGPVSSDICYATQNRQLAVQKLATVAPVILVVGSQNSSNSCRLVEVARNAGAAAHLIDDIEDINPAWLCGLSDVGVTAGASAPENLVSRVVEYLRNLGYTLVETVGDVTEDVEFALPADLVSISPSAHG